MFGVLVSASEWPEDFGFWGWVSQDPRVCHKETRPVPTIPHSVIRFMFRNQVVVWRVGVLKVSSGAPTFGQTRSPSLFFAFVLSWVWFFGRPCASSLCVGVESSTWGRGRVRLGHIIVCYVPQC